MTVNCGPLTLRSVSGLSTATRLTKVRPHRPPAGGVDAVGHHDLVARRGGVHGVLDDVGGGGPVGVGRRRAGTVLPDVARGGGGAGGGKQEQRQGKDRGKN